MASSMYCPDCQRNVTPKKKFNWLAFIFLAGIFYIPVYLLKAKRCPVCGKKKSQMEKAKSDAEIRDIRNGTSFAS